VVGCDDGAIISGNKFANGCPSLCTSTNDIVKGKCMGFGCCQLTIPKGLKYFPVYVIYVFKTGVSELHKASEV